MVRFVSLAGAILVPVTGLEPVRCRHRWILSPLRLPIPSHRQVCHYFVFGDCAECASRVPVSCCGARPSPWRERLRRWSTAATRSGRCICHRQRSPRSPDSHLRFASDRHSKKADPPLGYLLFASRGDSKNQMQQSGGLLLARA